MVSAVFAAVIVTLICMLGKNLGVSVLVGSTWQGLSIVGCRATAPRDTAVSATARNTINSARELKTGGFCYNTSNVGQCLTKHYLAVNRYS